MSRIKGESPNVHVSEPIHHWRTRSNGIKIKVKIFLNVADKIRYNNGFFLLFNCKIIKRIKR